MGLYNNIVKRVIDIIFAVIAIVLLLPVFILVSIIIGLTSDGSIIFKQLRMGYKGKTFCIYKFRTASVYAPSNICSRDLRKHGCYINNIGKFLRATGIDELPQLINIIKGDMSLIGPRPVILEEKELIEKRRNCGADRVRPGLTGFAQINGRDYIDIDDKVMFDKYYAENIDFHFDAYIFFKTILYVLFLKDTDETEKSENSRVQNTVENN